MSTKEKATTRFACGPSTKRCQCRCPDGDCEHRWDGERERIEHDGGSVSASATCSRCGMSAMSHDMWVSP